MKKKKILKVIFAILIVLTGFYIFKPQMVLLNFTNPEITSMMKYRMKEAKINSRRYYLRQRWIDYNKISRSLIKAVVLAEDEKFWDHHGFDWEGIKYALEYDIKKRKIARGGSTITQQLAKNLYLKPKRSFLRKLHEAILAAELELLLSKERILEIYLNVVEWGNGIFGCEIASQYYFNKSCSNLNDDEALRLAAVLPNPIRYSPVRYSRFLEKRLEVLREKFYRNTNSKITK